ncbi:hypothetical protein CHS0354_018604 [Potamilus streckersoni]|uniref:Uncharacterized protein n=1 Tax=Potamilus streckersoni TaxID=2493646 RepID=A0AAE0TER6_9BIVA|nr:hypothetical protein CHS0354_018604 [Potamilus streckersoni]
MNKTGQAMVRKVDSEKLVKLLSEVNKESLHIREIFALDVEDKVIEIEVSFMCNLLMLMGFKST